MQQKRPELFSGTKVQAILSTLFQSATLHKFNPVVTALQTAKNLTPQLITNTSILLMARGTSLMLNNTTMSIRMA